jgi:hypothetical protein
MENEGNSPVELTNYGCIFPSIVVIGGLSLFWACYLSLVQNILKGEKIKE